LTVTWTLHHGDALTCLQALPADSIDATITDPPYNSGAATITARISDTARGKYVSGDARHQLPDFPARAATSAATSPG
jgi:site-specific DNA-methyltransferase (adenine-specific)